MRSWLALGLVGLCVVGVVAAVLRSDGRPGTEAAINDGGAWLLNRDAGAVGHLNREVLEVTAAVRITTSGADFDIDQGEGVVLVHDRTDSRVLLLDERTYSPRAEFVVGADTMVKAIDGGAVLYETAPLRVWSMTIDELLDVAELESTPPTFQSDKAGAVGIAQNGDVAIVEYDDDGETATLTNVSGGVAEPERQTLALGPVTQLIPFSGGALILNDHDVLSVTDDGSATILEDVAVVQQATRGMGDRIAWIADSGQVMVTSIETGIFEPQGAVSGQSFLEPIYHQGCVFTVALQPREFAKFCDGAELERVPLDGTEGELRLRLVNGWVWINDLTTGGAWVTSGDSELTRLDDWGSALAEQETDDAEATVEDAGSDAEQKENPDSDDAEFVEADELDEDNENEPPVAVDDAAATRSERPILIPVLENDTDTDGDVLFISSVATDSVTNAIVTLPPGSDAIQIVPDAGFIGAVQFSYTVSDGRGGEANANVTVDVLSQNEAGNQPPVAKTDIAAARAGSPVSLNVLDNDTDPEGDTLILLGVEGPSGVVSSDPSGQITFTPDTTGDDGIIDLTYVVEDDYGATAEGRVRVRVRIADSNNPPDARNDLVITNVGSSARVNVLDNDNDPDDDPMYVAKQPEVKGVPAGVSADDLVDVRLTPDGDFSFNPPVAGTYRFEYLISDGQNNDRAQIRIEAQVAEADQPPVAVRDDVAIPIGGTRMVYVLDNDRDPNGDVVGIVEWDEAEGLQIREVPGVGFAVTVEVGAPSRVPFRYAISDGKNEAVSAMVIVAVADVSASNQPPQLAPDSFEVRAGRTSRLPVLLNDHDPEGGSLEIVRVPELLTEDSDFAIGPLGQTIELTVPAGQVRGFTFGYDVADVDDSTSATTVDVRIINPSEPNRPPIARVDVGRTVENLALAIDVLLNDSDPDSDFIQVESISQQPAFGAVALEDDGRVVYTPVSGFTGTDRFSYVVIDTEGGRSIGEVEIGVMPRPLTNRAPKANPDQFAVQAGEPAVTFDALSNDVDPDGDPLTIVEVGGASVGTVSTDGGVVTYVPPSPEALGPDAETEISVYYQISDGAGHTDESVITIRVQATPEPIPPVANDDQAGPVVARTTVLVPVLLNDSDPDGNGAALRLSSSDSAVSVVGESLQIVAGVDSSQHVYTVTDTDGLTDTATVTLFVVDNQAPVLTPLVTQTAFGQPLAIKLDTQASDVDQDPLFFVCCDSPQGGSVAIDSSSRDTLSVTFTPNDGFSGEASFSYSADDQQGHLVSGSVTVVVLPPDNRPPVIANTGAVNVEAGTIVPFDLSTLVTDPDAGDTFSFEITGTTGIVPVTRSGSVLSIDAPLTSAGQVSTVTFAVTDAAGARATGDVVVTIVPTSHPKPTAVADTVQTNQGLAVPINLTANDIDPVGRGLTVTQVGATPAGTYSASTPGSILFQPAPTFFGTATFTYTIGDATNDVSRQSVGQVTLDIIGRPGQPQAPTATANNAVAAVTWTAPAANGAAIDAYRIEIRDLTGGSTVEVDLGVQNSHVASGLVNGREYAFRLQARNSAGWGDYGPWSAAVRPNTIPGRPASPTVTFADGQLNVNWAPPVNDGSALTEYKLEIGGGSSAIVSLPPSGTSYAWTGLSNGVEYQFRVVATNIAGDSTASGWSTSEHPLGAPLAPTAPVAQRGNQFLDINWTPPSNNGDPIATYQVEVEGGAVVTVTGGGTTNYRWAQLVNGVEYRFRVRAANRAPAPGSWSAWSTPVKPCAVPNAAGAPGAIRGDRQATISWSAPNNQGCAISGYNIRANGGAVQSVGGGSLSHTFTSLTNGTGYTFEVQAVNEEGVGPWSAVSASVVPAGPPTAPTISSVTASGVGQLTAAWGGASPNGDAISSYNYRLNGGSAVSVVGTSVVRSGLNNSTAYSFQVQACNAVGCGAWSGSAGATTWGPPGAPASISLTPSDRAVSLFWANPTSDGGQPITSWQLIEPNAPSLSGLNSRVYSGLTNGTTYTVQVRACNVVGCGPYASASATPVAPPPWVTVSVGRQYAGGPNCPSGDCQWIQVTAANLTPNKSIQIQCHSSGAGLFVTYTRTVASDGSLSTDGCFFGNAGQTVWVFADGVRSNTFTWP